MTLEVDDLGRVRLDADALDFSGLTFVATWYKTRALTEDRRRRRPRLAISAMARRASLYVSMSSAPTSKSTASSSSTATADGVYARGRQARDREASRAGAVAGATKSRADAEPTALRSLRAGGRRGRRADAVVVRAAADARRLVRQSTHALGTNPRRRPAATLRRLRRLRAEHPANRRDESLVIFGASPLTPARRSDDAAAVALANDGRGPRFRFFARAAGRRGGARRAPAAPRSRLRSMAVLDGSGSDSCDAPSCARARRSPASPLLRARAAVTQRAKAPCPPIDHCAAELQILLHPRRPRTVSLERARCKTTSPDMLKRLSRANRDALGEEPDLAVREPLRGRRGRGRPRRVVSRSPSICSTRRPRRRDGLPRARLHVPTDDDVGRESRRRRDACPHGGEPCSSTRRRPAVAAAFDAEGRTAFHRAVGCGQALRSCAARDAVQGAQYSMKKPATNDATSPQAGPRRDAYHTFCHRDEKWRRDATYKRDVVELLFKMCELERIFVPRLGICCRCSATRWASFH